MAGRCVTRGTYLCCTDRHVSNNGTIECCRNTHGRLCPARARKLPGLGLEFGVWYEARSGILCSADVPVIIRHPRLLGVAVTGEVSHRSDSSTLLSFVCTTAAVRARWTSKAGAAHHPGCDSPASTPSALSLMPDVISGMHRQLNDALHRGNLELIAWFRPRIVTEQTPGGQTVERPV